MSVRRPDAASRGSASDVARALWLTAPRVAELRTEPVGSPGRGEVLVRSMISLVSPGTEAVTDARPQFPLKSAHQVVARVEDAGPDVRHAEGDVILVRHAHQDRFVVADDPGLVFTVPDDLPPERAVFASLVDIAVTAVLDVPIRIGDAVVVYGGGTVGGLCAQLAKATAGAVIVVDALEAHRDRARTWGADAAVEPIAAPGAVRELTDGRGADVAIEASGDPAFLQAAIEVTGQEGTVVAVTFFGSGEVPLRLSPEFHYRRQRMVSTQVGSVGAELQPRWSLARRMQVGFELLRSERVHVDAARSLPFDRAPEAPRLVDGGRDLVVEVLLEY
jgi:threonine dehydrogenase-like Zn-dependent dehydrogenase